MVSTGFIENNTCKSNYIDYAWFGFRHFHLGQIGIWINDNRFGYHDVYHIGEYLIMVKVVIMLMILKLNIE